MPLQERVRREQGADFLESSAAEDSTFDRQAAPLLVVQQDSPFAELSLSTWFSVSRRSIAFLLLTVQPASKDDHVERPTLKDEGHGRSIRVRCVQWPSPSDDWLGGSAMRSERDTKFGSNPCPARR
jgi:hypothetical protein